MIVYTSKDSFLEIPKGLGNFSTGGSADVEPLSGSVIELSATTVTLSGAVETLNESVDSQGDAIADLLLDVTALEDNTSGNTADISALSAATEGIEGTVRSVVSDVETISGQTSANTADIATLSGQVETLSSSTVTGLETAQNAANSANTLASSAYTLADSAYTRADAAYDLAESLTGATGGIEKVDELPATAEEGDVVWLNGATGLTGYTITANGDNWASWPWELDRNYFNINDRTINIRGSARIGKWTKTNDLFSYWDNFPELIMRVRRNSTDGGPVYDFIDPTGQYTITAGSDALSITTNTFSRSGSLYVYSGGKWYRKAEREIYFSTTGSSVTDLVESIWFGIEDADYDNLVIRYAPNGKDIREFKITTSAFYGIDMQCSDDRGTVDSWGRLSVFDYRMGRDGSISDMVGEKWIVSEDQISHPSQQNIQITSTGSFPNPSEFDILSSESNMYRIYFRYNGDNGVDWAQAPLKYVWRRKESINGEEKLVYYWAVENLFINGTAYSGSWHSNEYDWNNYVTDSWAAQ